MDFENIGLEQFIDDLQRAAEHQVEHSPPVLVRFHHRHERPHANRHIKHALQQHRHHPRAPVYKLAIVICVFFRIFRYLLTRLVDIDIGQEMTEILEQQPHRRFGVKIIEAVFGFQSQFVIHQQRVGLNHPMHRGMLVVEESRRSAFERNCTAADEFLHLQHQHLLACLGHIGGSAKLVMACAHDDNIVIAHLHSP